MNTNRQLLMGLLALQCGFITKDQLVAAFSLWTSDKKRSLESLLVEKKAISAPQQSLLAALVEEHLKQHDNDPEKSLVSVGVHSSVKRSLVSLPDQDLQASVMPLPSPAQDTSHAFDDPFNTVAIPQNSAATANRFRILRLHAMGGLGLVSVALDEELKREVAFKEIKAEYADRTESRKRFVREAEITGALEHPNIVPVYGLGSYGDGRPYYVMRFIKGDSLKDWITQFHRDKEKLPAGEKTVAMRQILSRFVDVCQAMHYAHSRGVLHRDLKPHNVMLGKYGETLVVDWGLAKTLDEQSVKFDSESTSLMSRRLSDAPEVTTQGAAIGTPAYMSPEQAEGKIDELGPSTDIYSLGVTLYHCLTGRVPFDQTTEADVMSAVRKGEYPRPREIDKSISKSLDAICHKAMAPKPIDRYSTARELASDIELYLADEPVRALPESAMSRVGRWTRRNRRLVAFGVASLLLVTAISIGFAISNNELRKSEAKQKQNAVEQQIKAIQLSEENKKIALANKALAESEMKKSQEAQKLAKEMEKLAGEMKTLAETEQAQRMTSDRLADFLTGLFYTADPIGINVDFYIPKGNVEKLTAKEILDRGAKQVQESKELAAIPLAKARILNAIGDVNRQLGRFPEAQGLLEDALKIRSEQLGDQHEITAESLHSLGQYYHERGDFDKAAELYRKAIAIREKIPGLEGQKARTVSMYNLAWMMANEGEAVESEKLFQQVLEIRRSIYGDLHRETAFAKMGIAFALIEQNRMFEVIPFALAFRSDFEKLEGVGPLVDAATNLVMALATQVTVGSAFAEGTFRKSLEQVSEGLGKDNIYTGVVHCELATCLQRQRKWEEAEKHFRASLEIAKAKVDMQHPRVGLLVVRFANLLADTGRAAEGAELWEEFLKAQRKRFGDSHRYIADALYDYGVFLHYSKQFEQSAKRFQEFLEVKLPDERQGLYSRGAGHYSLGLALLEKRPADLSGAEKALRECLSAFAKDGATERDQALVWVRLAMAVARQKRLPEAEEAISRSEQFLARSKGAAPGIWTEQDLSDLRDRIRETRIVMDRVAGRGDKVVSALESWIKEREKQFGAGDKEARQIREELARVFESMRRWPDALGQRAAVLAAYEAALRPQDARVLTARSALANTHVAAKEYDKAVSLLEKNRLAISSLEKVDNHRRWVTTSEFAGTLLYTSRKEESLALFQALYDEQLRIVGADDIQTVNSLGNLFLAKILLGRREAAEQHWTEYLSGIEKLAKGNAGQVTGVKANMARLLSQHGQYERAESLLREVVAYCQVHQAGQWTLYNAQSLLGEALLELGRMDDAASLLRSSWEGLVKTEKELPVMAWSKMSDALMRLVALEEALQRPAEAEKWRQMLHERENRVASEE